MDLLRFITAGSVDDGKSTLIGRLLYDSKSILADQLEAIERQTKNKANGDIDLALLTDGLRAEREQGITIDVAYKYFSTPAPAIRNSSSSSLMHGRVWWSKPGGTASLPHCCAFRMWWWPSTRWTW
jgi:hypothetical protein